MSLPILVCSIKVSLGCTQTNQKCLSLQNKLPPHPQFSRYPQPTTLIFQHEEYIIHMLWKGILLNRVRVSLICLLMLKVPKTGQENVSLQFHRGPIFCI